MQNIAVIYNACGLNGKDNSDWYIKCVNSILSQSQKLDVFISGCLLSSKTKETLIHNLSKKVMFSWIDELYTVNTTFNKTAIEISRNNYEYFIFIDSGCYFLNKDTIKNAIESCNKKNYGIAAIQASNDNGTAYLGLQDPLVGEDYVFKPGESCNGHVTIFHKSILDTFGILIPDIFKAFCTESMYSYLSLSVNKKYALLANELVGHNKSVDGASIGFSHIPNNGLPWDNIFGSKSMQEIIQIPEVIESGIGYEECNNILVHNSNCYDENLYHKNPKQLIDIIKKYFIRNDLNYEKIKSVFIS